MNIFAQLMNTAAPVWAPEDGTGSGGESAAGAAGGEGAGADDAAGAAEEGQDVADDGSSGTDGNASAGDDGDGQEGDGEASGDDADDNSPGEFKLTAPEGMEDFQGEFDTYSSEASEWMQANPKATAADALKWAAERQSEAVAKQTQDMSEAFTKQIETWEGEAKADKEIGGDAFDANLATAKKAIDTFGSDGLKAVLNESGLGSHPEIIKFAFKAGQALADSPVIKTNDGAAKKSLADTLYGKK